MRTGTLFSAIPCTGHLHVRFERMFHSRPWTSIPRADRVCGANVAISFPKNSVNYRTDFPGAAAAREVPEHQIRGSMGEATKVDSGR